MQHIREWCKDVRRCSDRTLLCPRCAGYCNAGWSADMDKLQPLREGIVLDTQQLEQLRRNANVMFMDFQTLRDHCYDHNRERLTDIQFLGGGGAGEAYKRCARQDRKLCYVYKITKYDGGLFSLSMAAIVFQKYLDRTRIRNLERMNLVREYGNFDCRYPPRGSNLPPGDRFAVSVLELAAMDLKQLLEKYRLPVCVFRSIVMQVIFALEAWGYNRINHNDLKADNIFIRVKEPSAEVRHGYHINLYGIKPLLADYDWVTFDTSPPTLREIRREIGDSRTDIRSDRSRYYIDSVETRERAQGWQGQSRNFNPRYDLFSFIAELVYRLATVDANGYLLQDFYPFAVQCLRIPGTLAAPTRENIKRFIEVTGSRGFRLWRYREVPETLTPRQVIDSNPLEYFSPYKQIE